MDVKEAAFGGQQVIGQRRRRIKDILQVAGVKGEQVIGQKPYRMKLAHTKCEMVENVVTEIHPFSTCKLARHCRKLNRVICLVLTCLLRCSVILKTCHHQLIIPQSQFKSPSARRKAKVGSPCKSFWSHRQFKGGNCSELSCLRSANVCISPVL